jgi:hypothetical protein
MEIGTQEARTRPTQREKTSPFRPQIALRMPQLGQCEAIEARRYMSPATGWES